MTAALALVWCGMGLPAPGAVPAPASRDHYDVAAFVWPSYYPDKRARIFWPLGIGEWEIVMNAQPKFPGHEQPRRPLWGYINEADPRVMEMELAAAADHGVNVFIFDWYWYDGMPFLEDCLNQGYLKARNRDRVKFYLMWANHDASYLWDKRNADDYFSGQNRSTIWKGGVDRPEFEKIAHRWIKEYFSQPSYYTIDGKPVFMMFSLGNFVQGLGGASQAQAALEWFRQETIKAGFKGLELQLAFGGKPTDPVTINPGESAGTQHEVITQLGFNSLTHYQFVNLLDVDRDYADIVRDVAAAWAETSRPYSPLKYYPNVSIGWDTSPRAKEYVGKVAKKSTPAEFEKALILAKGYIDARPDQAPLIIVNSWNEWTESSYLQPDETHGYGYLEAVQRVFKK